MNKTAITEADLHAYLDGELPPDRREEVEKHLADHPDAASRLQAYEADKRALRQLFDPVLAQPLPEPIRVLAESGPTNLSPSRSWLSRWSLQRIAAGLAIAVISGVIGWNAHGRYQPAQALTMRAGLPRQAAIAHVVYSPDVKRPVEIGAEQEDQLVTWLSKRLGSQVRPPRLGRLGYELIGGRLLPGTSGPVAQFMYHDASGQRLTLYVSAEIPRNQDTAFRFAQEGPVNVFYWIDGNFGYALSAGLPRNELSRIATSVYDQLERR